MKPAFLLVLFVSCFALTVTAQQIQNYPEIHYATPGIDNGELLVDFKDYEQPGVITSLFRSLGLTSSEYSLLSADEKLFEVRNLGASLIRSLEERPDVEGVEPDFYMSAFLVPNDPYYKYQWNMDMIGMKQAWDYPKGAPVVVAVIDTGIAFEKYENRFPAEDFDPSQFVSPYNFISKNKHPNDDHGHGTHVAGTIAELTNNNVGVAGIAPAVKLMPLKVLNASGYGTISDIAAAIRYAADHGARVINMSLGGPFPSFTLHKAIKYARGKGVVIVCAAGNSGGSGLSYPAAYPECISVSAVRFDGTLAWYSSYGKGLTIAAPGGDMNVDQNGDGLVDGILQNTLHPQDPSKQGYFLFQGTSMAAPHVAAAAALLISQGITDPARVRYYLQKTATAVQNGSREQYGAGILNINAALHAAFQARRIRTLILAVFLFLVIISLLNRGRGKTEKVGFGLLPALGLVIAATGFFFFSRLPYAGSNFLLTHSAAEWPAVFGAWAFANPLLLSAAPALLAALLFYPWRGLASLSVGFACGFAAFLLFHAVSPTSGIAWIPGSFLQSVWLLFNALVSLGVAAAASFRLK